MTTLLDTQWLTHAEYRKLVGAAPLALLAVGDGVQIDALGRRWDPRKHPRGRDGRFIEVGGLVKFFESLNGRNVAGSGVVTRINGDTIFVHVGHHNIDPSLNGSVQSFNKRQIATIPPGEVRLDRNGNVHPDDRQLPDKNGKLVQVGDTVRVGDKTGKVTRVDDNSGRVVVRNSDGLHVMRRVETVERLDTTDTGPAQPDQPAARLDRAAPIATPVARVSNPVPRSAGTRVADLPVEQPLEPNNLESLLQRHGFDEVNAIAAHHLDEPNAVEAIRADPAYSRLRLAHDRALRQVMPSARERSVISDFRKVEATLARPNAAAPIVPNPTPRGTSTPQVPRQPVPSPASVPNNVPGPRSNISENADPRFDGAALDAMINDLPNPPAQGLQRQPLIGAERYARNLKLALRDQRQASSAEQRAHLDIRIRDYFGRALDGRPADSPRRRIIEDVQRRWEEMRGGGAPPTPAPAAPASLAPRSAQHYERQLRAATDSTQVDVIAQEIENDPNLSEAEKYNLAGVVNEIRDNGPANADPGTPAPPAPPTPAAPARRPRMQPGVRGRGQFAGAVLRNYRGEELRVGVVVRTNQGTEGYVARLHPPSNRVVIKNANGLEVMRDVDTVRVQYEGDAPRVPAQPVAAPGVPVAQVPQGPQADAGARAQAIVDMHEAGARRGFPLEPEVGLARNSVRSAVTAANGNQPEAFKTHLEAAIRNYDAALARGIRNHDLEADVRLRRDAAQAVLNDVAAGRAVVGNPHHDAVLNLNGELLRGIRAQIPTMIRDIPGAGNPRIHYRNAGFALDDALDTSRGPDERRRALARARYTLERARDGGQQGADALLVRLDGLGAPAGPAAPAARTRGVGAPDANTVRPNVPRPTHSLALNPNARAEDYAQEWGIERGDEIARAARERPKLESITAAGSNSGIKQLAAFAFDGEYGNSGLIFKVTSASGRNRNLSVSGTVYKDGRSVGTFDRSVNDTGVYNAYFKINSGVQAGGAATEFNRHMENWYIANGVKRVTVSAGLTHGGFVWARNGFDFQNGKGSAAGLINSIERNVRPDDATALAQVRDIRHRIDTLDATDPNFPTPFELSQVGWKPGMGRRDAWAGKSGMMGTGWAGVKELNPQSRAYQQQVREGRLPDPSVKEHPAPAPPPAPRYYGAQHVPDDVRAFTFEHLSGIGRRGAEGELGNYHVQYLAPAGSLDNPGGVNDTFILTSKTDGRKYIIKRESNEGSQGAQAEVNVANFLQGVNVYGTAHVEVSPHDDSMIISTYVGEQNNMTDYRKVGVTVRAMDDQATAAFVAGMANPSELVRARLANAIIANFDRHGNNAYFAKDENGEDHLLLFDHGLSLNPISNVFSLDQIIGNQTISYGKLLGAHLSAIGPAASEGEVGRVAQEFLSWLTGSSIPEPHKTKMIERAQSIVADPAKYLGLINV